MRRKQEGLLQRHECTEESLGKQVFRSIGGIMPRTPSSGAHFGSPRLRLCLVFFVVVSGKYRSPALVGNGAQLVRRWDGRLVRATGEP